MFISKLVNWIDRNDAYGLGRVIFHKTLIIATIMVYAYWLFRPTNFLAFVAPGFVVTLYEAPLQIDRDKFLFSTFAGVLICSISFYLIYPFKFVFLFYALITLTILYFIYLRYFPDQKNVPMLIIATAALHLNSEQVASLQTLYDIFFSTLLSMSLLIASMRLFPGNYQFIWRCAARHLLSCLEKEMDFQLTQDVSLKQDASIKIFNSVQHYNMMRCFYKRLPFYQWRHALKVNLNLRNIHYAINNIRSDNVNGLFWHRVKHCLHHLNLAMRDKKQVHLTYIPQDASTSLQTAVIAYLHRTMFHWNRLCDTHVRT